MKQMRYFLLLTLVFIPFLSFAQESTKLTGTVIGTELSVDYSTGNSSYTVNSCKNAFDGDLSTYFASYERSRTWCGLDLGTKHVITRIGWSPRNDSNGPSRVVLALFEGANEPDFSDAILLYMNDTDGTIGKFQYADINVTRGFRYVRYVGPNEARCNIAEVEFYGYEGEGSDEQFYRPTNLPLVLIQVENNEEPYDKVHDLNCTVTLIPSDENDTIKTKTGTIRLRGNNSMTYDKKPYRVKFDKKHHVFGSPASAKKWTLINNHCDKTLMRNILAFEASRRLDMPYTPFCQPVDVIVNGEYRGSYQLCDKVEVHSNRVDVEEMEPTDITGNALTGGYLVEVDAYATSEKDYFISSKATPVTIKYPDDDDIAYEQRQYIIQQFSLLESAVFSSSYTNSTTGYRTRLDIDSFLRYFLLGEFTGNTDTFWSTYMYKYRNDLLFYFGPVWDSDLAFENDVRTHPINNHSDYVYTFASWAGNFKNLVDRIIKNDSRSKNELLDIWTYARRNRGMTPESFLAYVDETVDLLNESQRLNFIRWPILNTYLNENWEVAGSFEGEVDIVRDYIKERFDWLDRKLGFDPSGIVDVEISNNGEDNNIYSVDGRMVGTNVQSLPKGIYIRNGKKFIVK